MNPMLSVLIRCPYACTEFVSSTILIQEYTLLRLKHPIVFPSFLFTSTGNSRLSEGAALTDRLQRSAKGGRRCVPEREVENRRGSRLLGLDGWYDIKDVKLGACLHGLCVLLPRVAFHLRGPVVHLAQQAAG